MSRRSVVGLLLLVGISFPFVLDLIGLIRDAQHPFYTFGDTAMIDLAISQARAGHQLLGPYSRFGWSHPGPSYFYLQVPFSFLVHDALRVYLGALLINWISAIGSVGLVCRRFGPVAATVVALGLLLFVRALGEFPIEDPWNPAIVILPLFLAATTAAVRPSAATAGVLVFTASFVVQTHVGTTPAVGVLIVIAVVAYVVDRRRPWAGDLRGAGGRIMPCLKSIAVVFAVLALCWIVPVIEQIQSDNGNLGQVMRFFADAEKTRSLTTAADVLARALWLPTTPMLAVVWAPPVDGWLMIAGFIVVAAAATVLAYRQRSQAAFVFSLFPLLAVPATLLSLTKAAGELYGYLIWWTPLLAVSALTGVVLVITQNPRPLRRLSGPVVTALLATAVTAAGVGTCISFREGPEISAISRNDIDEAWQFAEDELPPKGDSVFLDIRDSSAVATAVGIAVELEQAGRGYTMDPKWRRLFGNPHPPSRQPTQTFTFALPGQLDENDARPAITVTHDISVVVATGNVELFRQR